MNLFYSFYPNVSDLIFLEDSGLHHICVVFGDHKSLRHFTVCCDFCVLSIQISGMVFWSWMKYSPSLNAHWTGIFSTYVWIPQPWEIFKLRGLLLGCDA